MAPFPDPNVQSQGGGAAGGDAMDVSGGDHDGKVGGSGDKYGDDDDDDEGPPGFEEAESMRKAQERQQRELAAEARAANLTRQRRLNEMGPRGSGINLSP